MLVTRFVAGRLAAALMVLGASMGYGQDYPNKPIRIITGSVGGSNDLLSRQIAQGISGPLGQPVIVENRGNGFLAAEAVYKTPPDGYTLTVQGFSLWLTPLLQKTPYDAVRDFSPISLISRDAFILVVHPSLPAKSVKELIALAKARPGALNYASTILGGPNHLAMELFKSMAGVNIVNVSYKGGAPGITALLSGEVQLTISDLGLAAPHMTSGKLRALAVTSAEPSALAPGVPAVAAAGLPGYEAVGVTVIVAPGKTPGPIVNRLNQEIVRFINRTDVKERFLSNGTEIVGSSPEELAAIIKADIAKWGKLIQELGIKNN